MIGSTCLLALSVPAAGALAPGRFVTFAGAYPAAGAAPYGVTRMAAGAAGELTTVDVLGTSPVESGGAVAAGDAVQTDATGRAVTLAGGVKVGRALTAAAAAGTMVEVLLFPSA